MKRIDKSVASQIEKIHTQTTRAGTAQAESMQAAWTDAWNQQQLIGSRMLSNLNEGGDTLPGVTYTSIATRHDQIVTPPESSFLRPGPDAEVHNVWVQDGCPDSPADHSTILVRPESLHLVKSALDPGYAAAHAVPCDLPENG